MPLDGRLTRKRFWDRIEAAERVAEVRGARFEDDTPERQLRRKAEAVVFPERFNALYLPHYFRSDPAPFHLDLYRALERDRRIVVRAPRGHAKSTVITFAYALHQVVCAPVLRAWETGTLETDDPGLFAALQVVLNEAGLDHLPHPWDPYIQIVSVTVDQAGEFTAAIKLELEENELIRSDWGELLTGRAKDDDWVSASGVRVRAFGMRGSIRGGKHRQWRPTLAILDDPDSEETVTTERMRNRQTKKLTAAVNYGLEPRKSRVIAIGTPVHADCLVCRLTEPKKFRRWTKIRLKAITDEGRPLWTERWADPGLTGRAAERSALANLEAEREEDEDAFEMEMMDTPPNEGDQPFQVFHYYSRADYSELLLPKVLVFDPALGRTEKSDFQALVVLRGPTPDKKVLIHRVELLRIADPLELVAHVNGIYAEEEPDLAAIETVGFQVLLEVMLTTEGDASGLFPGWTRVDRQTTSKDLRIRSVAPLSNRGVLVYPDDGTCRRLERQAREYPHGKRDGLDMVEMGMRFIRLHRRRSLARQARFLPGRAAGFGADPEYLPLPRGASFGARGW